MRLRVRTLVGTTVLALVAGVPAALAVPAAGATGTARPAAAGGTVASTTHGLRPLGKVDLRTMAPRVTPKARAAKEAPSTPLGRIAPELPENRQVGLTNPGGPAPGSLTVPSPKPVPIAGKDGDRGFPGLTARDQLQAGTGAYAGTQLDLEPPDQALCTDGTQVLEGVNTAVAVYRTDGSVVVGATPLNQFFGLKPVATTVGDDTVYGDFTSDPQCLFDVGTRHWFLTVLQADLDPKTGGFTGPSSILVAASATSDPTGAWYRYVLDTTNGNGTTPGHPNCPCLGDQPLIGADAFGFYISTNEYPFFEDGFNGAQLYALSRRALGAGTAKTVQVLDQLSLAGGLAGTVQPARTFDRHDYSYAEGGTEYFLSNLDVAGIGGTVGYPDDRIAVWALSGTSSLDWPSPRLALSNRILRSEPYFPPVPALQKPGPQPLADLLLKLGYVDTPQKLERLNTNDSRMNQVVYADGQLWAGLNTRIGGPDRTGIAWFDVVPFGGARTLHAALLRQGYVAAPGQQSVMFPSIAVGGDGRPVLVASMSGPDHYPSVVFSRLAGFRFGPLHVAGAGVVPNDSFGGYEPFGDPDVARWGDYSAALTAPDGSVWGASEYISGPRSTLENWGTYAVHLGH